MTAALAGNLVFRQPPAVDRRFAGILLGSLAAHALLMLALHQPESPPPALPLQVSIRIAAAVAPVTKNIPPPAEPPAASATRVAAAVPPKARQSVTREEPRPAARADSSAGPAIASAPPAVAESAPASVPAAEAVTAAKPAPAAAPAVDVAAEAISAYRRQLTELFARPHEYPRIAALRGWEGEVRLRVKVARKGNLLGVQLDRSSGYEVLDRDALAMLEGYGKLPPLPDALDSNEISVVVPINYKLKKAT